MEVMYQGKKMDLVTELEKGEEELDLLTTDDLEEKEEELIHPNEDAIEQELSNTMDFSEEFPYE